VIGQLLDHDGKRTAQLPSHPNAVARAQRPCWRASGDRPELDAWSTPNDAFVQMQASLPGSEEAGPPTWPPSSRRIASTRLEPVSEWIWQDVDCRWGGAPQAGVQRSVLARDAWSFRVRGRARLSPITSRPTATRPALLRHGYRPTWTKLDRALPPSLVFEQPVGFSWSRHQDRRRS
jgi:hypothetical protein